eukprot:8534772-Prorocentrum_lima.AAC.1
MVVRRDSVVGSRMVIDEDMELVCIAKQREGFFNVKCGRYGVHYEHSSLSCVGVLPEVLLQGLFGCGRNDML